MTETKYTEKELQEMADALLKEADAQQHEIEEEVIKSNKGQLDEKTIASLPAAQLIQNNERLKELFIKGKRHGKLESNELSEVLDAMDLDSDKLDMIYDSLEKLSIEVTTEAFCRMSMRRLTLPWRRLPRSRRKSWSTPTPW